ncbi:hypothetical protein S1OALGB6SA_2246 [Olavius algarvensis spirochete endosymbiont]|nr:hypothetical protein S1OALGB6SA_2246 [Olavius algarvensis spirochete endosymbiont]
MSIIPTNPKLLLGNQSRCDFSIITEESPSILARVCLLVFSRVNEIHFS